MMLSPMPLVRRPINVVRMLVILIFILILPDPVAANAKYFVRPATIHFVAWQASGANNGVSWANAYQDLHTALQTTIAGDQVWVAEGVYRVSESEAGFHLKEGVQVLGGFQMGEADLSNRDWSRFPTILSGDRSANDGLREDATNRTDNSPTVVYANAVGRGTQLDGFILEGGYGGIQTPACLQGCGAGIALVDSSPVLSNLTITGNRAIEAGGGLYSEGGSPLLINSAVIGNQSPLGGGLFIQSGQTVVAYTSLAENLANRGSEIFVAKGSQIEIENSLLWDPPVSSMGAGIEAEDGSVANLHFSIPGPECPENVTCKEGVVYHDPLFLDSNGADNLSGTIDDDLRLVAYSPAINAGQPVLQPLPGRDLAGKPRLVDHAVDIGAFEHPDPNHAPNLENQPVILYGSDWIGTISQGILVSDLLQENVSDVDQDAVGMAVTAAAVDVGYWQYRLPSTISVTHTPQWTNLTNENETSAVLLTPDSLLRFVPEDGVSGTALLRFRAWDGTDRLDPFTSRANTIPNGYANPYSETESVLQGRNYPTSVTVYSFETHVVEEGISLTWETANELCCVGFYISRQTEHENGLVRITSTMIESQQPGSLMGGTYEWIDHTADPDLATVYILEVVRLDGSILTINANYTPVVPDHWQILLPIVSR